MNQPIIAPFGLRMSADLKERIKTVADAERRSLNFVIVEVLEREFPPKTETAGSAS